MFGLCIVTELPIIRGFKMKKMILQMTWAVLAPFISLILCRNLSVLILTTDALFFMFFIFFSIAQWIAILVWEINELSKYLKKK